MPDSNVLAVITAADNSAPCKAIIHHPKNARWLRAPDHSSRAGKQKAFPRLVLTFDQLQACPPESLLYGIKVGKAADSHVVLCDVTDYDYSDIHFNIVVYEDKRIFIVDWLSAQGTAVDYDGAHNSHRYQLRKQCKWIVAHKTGYSDVFETFTISIGQAKLRISFPNHASVNNHQYELNLSRLAVAARGTKTSFPYKVLPPLGSTRNVRITENRHYEWNIYYTFKLIHRREHSDIFKAIRACDGKAFAAKVYRCDEGLERRTWFAIIQGEFDWMNKLAHVSIACPLKRAGLTFRSPTS